MYEIIVTKRAEKDLDKLDVNIKSTIGRKIKEYSYNPFVYAKKLADPKIGSYRFRIGDHRVIFDIDGNKIIVLRVGHRKDIYK